METLTGSIAKICYQKEDGWGILLLEDGTKTTGTLPMGINESRAEWRFMGEWSDHPRFGRQFKFSSAVRDVPASGVALADYIDEVCPNVGPNRARAIVDKYGAQTLEILKTTPMRVADEISGITRPRALDIQEALMAAVGDETLTLGILEYLGQDGTQSLVSRIKEAWGLKAIQVIQETPYRLTEIWGIGFPTADRIAMHHKIPRDSLDRIAAGMVHVLAQAASNDGHTCLPVAEFILDTADLLDLSPDPIAMVIDTDTISNVKVVDGYAYLTEIYNAETNSAQNLILLSQARPVAHPIAEVPPADFNLADDQLDAFRVLLRHSVAVLTGAPGTGKTHTVRALLAVFAGTKIALCAPTGKAAKRLAELSKAAASTIHRLLVPVMVPGRGFKFTKGVGSCPACSGSGDWGPNDDPCRYCAGTGNKSMLEEDLIILDETSMLDIKLLDSILQAVRPGTRLIFVGDHHQLPSVGAGNVLKDLLNSFPSYTLTQIKRQAQGSMVVRACHQIKDGETPEWKNEAGADLCFIAVDKAEDVVTRISDCLIKHLPDRGRDPNRDVQVITALRKNTVLGCVNLNAVLQKAFNRFPQAGEFAIGDKVINLKNLMLKAAPSIHQKDDWADSYYAVNGDIGVVKAVLDNKKLVVQLENPDRLVEVPATGKDCTLGLAYAVTVHKFQGSEAPVIIVPIHSCLGPMVPQRNWLYTAISRARELCIVIGQPSEFGRVISRCDQRIRYSRLSEMISKI